MKNRPIKIENYRCPTDNLLTLRHKNIKMGIYGND